MPPQFERARRRVLVVDDDPAIRELITTRLELAGYQAFSARDGMEGLERISAVQPEALILDINMPVLDGFGVLRALGQVRMLTKVRTMVLTARNRPEDVREAIALGASDFLAKPFDDKMLLFRVARLLQKHVAAPRAAAAPNAASPSR
jgi:DNA-binding response OmpR family regulator